ncbi:TPA: hypothetical protein EYH33_07485, partial [Candidatus Bipolaricaulota bacterium]|nr:hypothetical protein [Candidatus Bipolaricaulota bacterium]
MDVAGRPSVPSPLELSLASASQPLFLEVAGLPWLVVAGRQSPEASRRVFGIPLGERGRPARVPVPLTPREVPDVRSYTAAVTSLGIWIAYVDRAGDVWLSLFRPDTEEVTQWRLGSGPDRPAMAAEGEVVHVVFRLGEAGSVYALAYVRADETGPSPPFVIEQVPLGIGSVPSPPTLFLSRERLYAAVGLEHRGGELAGTAEVVLAAFPHPEPSQVASYRLSLPGVFPQEHPYEWEGLVLAPLSFPEAIRPTDLYQPRGVPGVGELGLLVVGAKLYSGGQGQVQPVLVAFRDGVPFAWTPIAKTRSFTYFTGLRASSRGWHAAWVDMLGYGEYRIYYASTAEGEQDLLNRLGLDDAVYFLGTIAMGLVGGLALIPLFLMAGVPGLALLFFHYAVGGEDSLRYRWPKVLLVLGLLPYLVLKLALAGTFGGVPFAQWMSQPAAHLAASVLPFIPSLLGLGAMLIYWRKVGEPTLLPAWGT